MYAQHTCLQRCHCLGKLPSWFNILVVGIAVTKHIQTDQNIIVCRSCQESERLNHKPWHDLLILGNTPPLHTPIYQVYISMYGYVHFYIHLSGRHIHTWVCRLKYKARHYESLGTSAPYSVARCLPPAPPLSCIWLHDACHRFLFVTFPKCRQRFRNPISATICTFWRENDNCDGGCTIPGLLTITKSANRAATMAYL